ncbi:MAG: apolipoprotein N-acyltransferase [Candidatus Omnitrophota bacterium]
MPLIWLSLEYLQSHLLTGFGWCALGYSQYKNLPLIQIADFSGVYGVSFVIMTANVVIWQVIARLRSSRSNLKKEIASSALGLLAMTSLILIASYAYGFFRLNESGGENSVKVSVIQGNIPQEIKWDSFAADSILAKYSLLTNMAAMDNPDLIIWPETAFPGFLSIDVDLTDKLFSVVKGSGVPLLLGANTEENMGEYFNSAVLISDKGEILDKYDKTHLVPFGEYVPFSKKFPILRKLVLGQLGEFTPGREFKIFDFAGRRPRFGVLICFEDIFSGIAKKFVKKGARFLVVITNDAWYGRSPAAYQHAACSVFRAIENRVPVVRAANTGYSCFIDSKGRIHDSVEENKAHLFVTGYKTSVLKFSP